MTSAPGLGQGGEPGGQLGVGQHHRIAARQQDLAQLGPTGLRMLAAVGVHRGVVGPDVVGDLFDLGQTLLLDRAVGPLDVLAGDQLLPVAEPAVGRAGRDDVEQGHLVLVENALDGAVVELAGRVLLAVEVQGLVGGGLDERLEGRAAAGHLEVVAGDLDRHAVLDVPVGVLELLQVGQLDGCVEAAHVLGRALLDEGIQSVHDLPVVAGVLDAIEDASLSICWYVLRPCHIISQSVYTLSVHLQSIHWTVHSPT